MPVGSRKGFTGIEQCDRSDHASEQGGVNSQAADFQRPRLCFVTLDIANRLFWIAKEMVPDKIDRQQAQIDHQPLGPECHRPQKLNAAEISQEQRRIANRQ